MPEGVTSDPILDYLSKQSGNRAVVRMPLDSLQERGIVKPEDKGGLHVIGMQQTAERGYEIQIALQRLLELVARGFRVSVDDEGTDTIDRLKSGTTPEEAKAILEELRRNVAALMQLQEAA